VKIVVEIVVKIVEKLENRLAAWRLAPQRAGANSPS
jgi:hypothetical protein